MEQAKIRMTPEKDPAFENEIRAIVDPLIEKRADKEAKRAAQRNAGVYSVPEAPKKHYAPLDVDAANDLFEEEKARRARSTAFGNAKAAGDVTEK